MKNNCGLEYMQCNFHYYEPCSIMETGPVNVRSNGLMVKLLMCDRFFMSYSIPQSISICYSIQVAMQTDCIV